MYFVAGVTYLIFTGFPHLFDLVSETLTEDTVNRVEKYIFYDCDRRCVLPENACYTQTFRSPRWVSEIPGTALLLLAVSRPIAIVRRLRHCYKYCRMPRRLPRTAL